MITFRNNELDSINHDWSHFSSRFALFLTSIQLPKSFFSIHHEFLIILLVGSTGILQAFPGDGLGLSIGKGGLMSLVFRVLSWWVVGAKGHPLVFSWSLNVGKEGQNPLGFSWSFKKQLVQYSVPTKLNIYYGEPLWPLLVYTYNES